MNVKRGDIFLVKLDPVIGSEQGKTRPALIIQNDISNLYSPLTIIAPITSKIYPREYPTNVEVSERDGVMEPSTILLNQIRAIDKLRIVKKVGKLHPSKMPAVDIAIKVSLGLS